MENHYRVWDNEQNEYFQPIYHAFEGKLLDLSISLNGALLRRTIKHPCEHESSFKNRYVLERLVAIFDKTPFYIGDIFSFIFMKELDEKIELKGSFCWNEEELRYEIDIHDNPHYTCLSYISNGTMYDFKIIGNIHNKQ